MKSDNLGSESGSMECKVQIRKVGLDCESDMIHIWQAEAKWGNKSHKYGICSRS